ncbi:hypothetical protein C8F01DRAFT_1117367 [Mycena amicta]|nr:hypothetical protein C8F01DRAFT_1117367 [Mycena amicta]
MAPSKKRRPIQETDKIAPKFIDDCERIWSSTLERPRRSTEETTQHLQQELASLESTVHTWCRVGDYLAQIEPGYVDVDNSMPRLLIAGLCSAMIGAPRNPIFAMQQIYLVRDTMNFEEWREAVLVPGQELFLEICALQVLKLSRRGKHLSRVVEERGDEVLGKIMAGELRRPRLHSSPSAVQGLDAAGTEGLHRGPTTPPRAVKESLESGSGDGLEERLLLLQTEKPLEAATAKLGVLSLTEAVMPPRTSKASVPTERKAESHERPITPVRTRSQHLGADLMDLDESSERVISRQPTLEEHAAPELKPLEREGRSHERSMTPIRTRDQQSDAQPMDLDESSPERVVTRQPRSPPTLPAQKRPKVWRPSEQY